MLQLQYYDHYDYVAAVAMDTLLLLLGFTELVIAIASSGISCGVICFRNQVSKLEPCMNNHIHIKWWNAILINSLHRVSAVEWSVVVTK